jgi:hypothetical protein
MVNVIVASEHLCQLLPEETSQRHSDNISLRLDFDAHQVIARMLIFPNFKGGVALQAELFRLV